MSIFRRKPKARWVHPRSHVISKFFPHNPPTRGDIVLVDGERCEVLACPVKWGEGDDSCEWRMSVRGVKVRPKP